VGTGRGRRLSVQNQSGLLAHWGGGPDCGRISGGRVVSLLYAAGPGAHYSGASDRRAARGGVSFRGESVIKATQPRMAVLRRRPYCCVAVPEIMTPRSYSTS